jgi:hypothetical protein
VNQRLYETSIYLPGGNISPQTIRILIAGALFVHGIGHTLGLWKPASSLPFIKVNESALRLFTGTLWILIAMGFIASAMGFWGILVLASLWRSLAVIFAIISLVCLTIFGRNWPIFNFIGATIMNIVVIAAILWFHWPSYDMFGR